MESLVGVTGVPARNAESEVILAAVLSGLPADRAMYRPVEGGGRLSAIAY